MFLTLAGQKEEADSPVDSKQEVYYVRWFVPSFRYLSLSICDVVPDPNRPVSVYLLVSWSLRLSTPVKCLRQWTVSSREICCIAPRKPVTDAKFVSDWSIPADIWAVIGTMAARLNVSASFVHDDTQNKQNKAAKTTTSFYKSFKLQHVYWDVFANKLQMINFVLAQ